MGQLVRCLDGRSSGLQLALTLHLGALGSLDEMWQHDLEGAREGT